MLDGLRNLFRRKVVAAGPSGSMKAVHQPGLYDALGYRVAKQVRGMGGASLSGGTHDFHTRYDREQLINVSRGLDRDSFLYRAVINRWIDYVLGPKGLQLQAQTGIDGVNDRIEQELWPEFWSDPEERGIYTGQELSEITLRELGVAGDTLFAKLKVGKLQHIEAERIASNQRQSESGRIEQGVQLDKHGRILGFYVGAVSDFGGSPSRTSTHNLAAKDAIYIINRVDRSSQTRGVPMLVASMPIAHRIEDILTSEAIAWQVMSRIALTLNKTEQPGAARVTSSDGEARSDAADGDLDTIVSELGMALVFQGKDNQEIKGLQQTRPSQNFEASVKLFVRLFGIPLGMPLELILLDWGKLNYSSSRAVLLQAFIMFRRWQQTLIRRFFVPVYRWQVGRWIAEGKLAWRPGIFNHVWQPPSWPWIDEDKEVTALGKKLDRGLATQTEALSSLSRDRGEFLETRKTEIIEAHTTALEVEKATGGAIKADDVWRTLAGMDPGKTEQAVRAGKDGEDGTTNDDSEETPDGEQKT